MAFPNQVEREHSAAQLQAEFGDKTKDELESLNHRVSVAGRVMAKRGPFMVLQDTSGRIQLYASKEAQKELKSTTGLWDMGDIVSVSGALHKSGKGDLYVNLEGAFFSVVD